MAFKFCGPKLSLCGLVLSVWGIIQLTLMGIFYYIKAVALLEDLPLQEGGAHSIENFVAEVEAGYILNAYNCWIAALLYVITLVVSSHQFWMNNRSSLVMGVFYFLEVTVLIEDVHAIKGDYEAGNYQDYLKKTRENYFQTAVQCWIVAGIYTLMLTLSCVGLQQAKKAEKKAADRREDDEYSCQPHQGKK